MNERIETLAKAAGYDMINKAAMRALGFDVEKFAELIVRECANMAESFHHHHQYDFTGNLELHEFIKEHFGVEE